MVFIIFTFSITNVKIARSIVCKTTEFRLPLQNTILLRHMTLIQRIIFSLKLRINRNLNNLRLKNKSFTIISNNCWGGFVYQRFKLPYQSPTIGLFIPDRHYFRFCCNLKEYLESELDFIDPKDSEYYEMRRAKYGKEIDYPVAKLKDIEIWFTHYKSREEVLRKWNRRKTRVNYEKVIYKWSQRSPEAAELVKDFIELPLHPKIAFVMDDCKYSSKEIIKIPEYYELNAIGADETPATFRHLNMLEFLNSAF